MFSEPSYLVTEGVRVEVSTAWLKERSNPTFGHYLFAYKVTITNEGNIPIQVLRRKWDITDALGIHRIVEGEGVIGEQPHLAPGESHEYISGCDFTTPIGRMAGHYDAARPDGSILRVKIPDFNLFVPYYLN